MKLDTIRLINLKTNVFGGHSELAPPLPISNRTVKRLSADDSVVLPCESRSLPNTYPKPPTDVGGFYFYRIFYSYLYLKLVSAVPCLLAMADLLTSGDRRVRR